MKNLKRMASDSSGSDKAAVNAVVITEGGETTNGLMIVEASSSVAEEEPPSNNTDSTRAPELPAGFDRTRGAPASYQFGDLCVIKDGPVSYRDHDTVQWRTSEGIQLVTHYRTYHSTSSQENDKRVRGSGRLEEEVNEKVVDAAQQAEILAKAGGSGRRHQSVDEDVKQTQVDR